MKKISDLIFIYLVLNRKQYGHIKINFINISSLEITSLEIKQIREKYEVLNRGIITFEK